MINAMNEANVYRRNVRDVCCMHSQDDRLESFFVLHAGCDRGN